MSSIRDFDLPMTLEWPLVRRAIEEGQTPVLTRKGWRAFWAWRRTEGARQEPIDDALPENERALVELLVTEGIRLCETSRG